MQTQSVKPKVVPQATPVISDSSSNTGEQVETSETTTSIKPVTATNFCIATGFEPLETPVKAIFAKHNSIEDAKWIVEKIEEVLRTTELARPVVIWIERGFPDNLSTEISDLQTLIDKIASKNKNWSLNCARELGRYPIDPQCLEKLNKLYDIAKEKEVPAGELFEKNINEFFQGLGEGIEKIKKQRKNVYVEVEETRKEAFIPYLHSRALSSTTYGLIASGSSNSFTSRAIEFRSKAESHYTRDIPLGNRIREYNKLHPEAIHIVIRGAGHRDSLSNVLSGLDIKHESHVNACIEEHPFPQRMQDLYMRDGYKQVNTDAETSILLQGLIGTPIDRLLYDRCLRSSLTGGLLKLVLLLNLETLKSWYLKILPTAKGNMSELGQATLNFLSQEQTLPATSRQALAEIMQKVS